MPAMPTMPPTPAAPLSSPLVPPARPPPKTTAVKAAPKHPLKARRSAVRPEEPPPSTPSQQELDCRQQELPTLGTTTTELAESLRQMQQQQQLHYQCDHSHQHEPAEGSQTKQTGFHTRQFASVIVKHGIIKSGFHVFQVSVPPLHL